MEQRILQGEPPEERKKALAANAFKVDPAYRYTRELEESELQERKDRLSQNMIKMDAAQQVLDEARLTHKTQVDPMKKENAQALTEIRTRSEEITGEVYLIKDEHEQRVGVYSPEGILLFERGYMPDERQYSIEENVRRIAN
jgi:hypothetical protein